MQRVSKIGILFFLAIAVAGSVFAGPAMTPLQSIRDLDKRLESYRLGENLSEADVEYNRKLKEEVITGTFDIAGLCKLALAQNWEPLKESERQEFVDLMTRLLQKKAIFSREQTKEKSYQISYLKEEFLTSAKDSAKVYTKIFVPKEKVTLDLNYQLRLEKEVWKIVDVVVDESSLVMNYRYQFNAIISKYGYPELVARMKRKLASFEQESAEKKAKQGTLKPTPAKPAATEPKP